MGQDGEITAEHVLRLGRSTVNPEIPSETGGWQTTSATRIVEAFRRRFGKARDAGVWQRLSNTVLEPANPFAGKSRRRVKQEAIILGTLVLTVLGLAVYFNFNSIVR